jgi:hypothetical protein
MPELETENGQTNIEGQCDWSTVSLMVLVSVVSFRNGVPQAFHWKMMRGRMSRYGMNYFLRQLVDFRL